MDEDKKQKIMVITMSCCLGIAVVIFLFTSDIFKGGSSVKMSNTVDLICVNPECGMSSEITREEYQESIQASGMGMGPMAMMSPVECPECGEISAAKGIKCKDCESVFMQRFGGDDFPDRCPECGYSDIEERRNNN